jgi:signal transduction histidine kinase
VSRFVSIALGALSIFLLAAIVAIWSALKLDALSPAATLRVFALYVTILVAIFAALATIILHAARVRHVRLEALKNALRLQRPVTSADEFGDLALQVNALIAELGRRRAENRDETTARDRDERLAELGRFAAGIAHEIRNPITNVIGFAALLRERCENEETRRDLIAIEEEARRCEAITDSITAFSRVPTIRAEPVELAELIVAPANLEVAIEAVEEARRVMADRILLRRVFDNLLVNARDAGARRVAVRVERLGARARILFSDDGRGIPAAIVERLFEPFATSRPGGLGLGLAIARGIVAAHGGELGARNRPEGGAEFEMTLPVGGVDRLESAR